MGGSGALILTAVRLKAAQIPKVLIPQVLRMRRIGWYAAAVSHPARPRAHRPTGAAAPRGTRTTTMAMPSASAYLAPFNNPQTRGSV